MSKNKTMNASDVFNATHPVFGKKASFADTFPTIEELHVDVLESGSGVRPGFHRRGYDSASAKEFVNCSNSHCFNGGFNLGDILREVVKSGNTTSETDHYCQGYEGSPKGKKFYQTCDHSFRVKISARYKATQPSASEVD
jgi:hypothetical protein